MSCALFLLALLCCLSLSLELLEDELVLDEELPEAKPLEEDVDVDEG